MLNFIKLYQAEYDAERNKYNAQTNETKKTVILLDIISVPFLLIVFYGSIVQDFLIKNQIATVHFSANNILSILMGLLFLVDCFICAIALRFSENARHYDYQLTNLLQDWQIPNQKTFAIQIETANKTRHAIKAKPNPEKIDLFAGIIGIPIISCVFLGTILVFWRNRPICLLLTLFLILISLVIFNIVVWYYISVLIKQAKTVEQSVIAQLT